MLTTGEGDYDLQLSEMVGGRVKTTGCRVMGRRETTAAINQGEGTPASNVYIPLLKNTEEHEILNILRLEYRLKLFA